ncbi:MAG: ABC transporter ATP-binding protein [Acidimicrobiia bacterium]|nr:ABC transporter ATP-binding protein [Acidimicrobiia bacterium]
MSVGVTVRGLSVRIDKHPVLHEVDLDVPGGRWLSVIGPNGAGKTTLLRAIVGLVRYSGTVEVDGMTLDQRDPRARARTVAVVPQQPELPRGMRVTDYVLLGRTPHLSPLGRESATDLELVGHILDRLDLRDRADRQLATLSGGELQRAVIGRALAQQTPVLLLDEPTTALDLGHQQDVLTLVEELRAADGLTVISTMHDLTVAGDHADELLLLAEGRTVVAGPAAEVLDPDVLASVYDTKVDIVEHEGRRIVLPRREGR